jgi:DNA-directed RNA polymerase subunit RPC12/RpoP|tara:strand:- start:386 stop:733 length:348 start_codon:yes stop_codon:yes gene_type:complete
METGLQYHSCVLCGEGNVLTLVFGGDYVCMRCIRDVMIPHIHLYKKFKDGGNMNCPHCESKNCGYDKVANYCPEVARLENERYFKKDQEHTLTADDNSYIPETGSSNCPSSSEEE